MMRWSHSNPTYLMCSECKEKVFSKSDNYCRKCGRKLNKEGI